MSELMVDYSHLTRPWICAVCRIRNLHSAAERVCPQCQGLDGASGMGTTPALSRGPGVGVGLALPQASASDGEVAA